MINLALKRDKLSVMTDGKGRTAYQLYQGGVLALEGGTEQ